MPLSTITVPSGFNFSECNLNVSQFYIMTLKNDSDHPVPLKLKFDNEKFFSVYPPQQTADAKSSAIFIINYKPTEIGRHPTKLSVVGGSASQVNHMISTYIYNN